MIHFGVDMDQPFSDLFKKKGTCPLWFKWQGIPPPLMKNEFGGVRDIEIPLNVNNIHCRFRGDQISDFNQTSNALYMNELTCATCHGYRPPDQAFSSVGRGKGCISGK